MFAMGRRGLWAALLCAANIWPSLAAWPDTPFVTSGQLITNAANSNVTFVGVNWPGHTETMLPEGLQYQSIGTIVSKIKALGMNVIRLTYAIEMIDQIQDNGGNDIPIQTAFINALGLSNGTTVYNNVVKNNPSLGKSTTRLQVFDAVAAECAKQQIYVHLDNHVSKAIWCCSPTDGNSWWGDTYFSTANWTRGLSYMAQHGKSWSNLVSMSLRNELRQPLTNLTLYQASYNWQDWYTNIKLGADAIHGANSDVLIYLSGLDSDTTLNPVVNGTALTPGTGLFNRDDFSGYSNKLVLELHNYANILNTYSNCSNLEINLFDDGFQTVSNSAPNKFPLVMTEFGFAQTDWQGDFEQCIESYLPTQRAGWMIWPLGGSYYIRQGTQDYDEPWGLLNHDWSDWRSADAINKGLIPMINSTLSGSAVNSTSGDSTGSSTSTMASSSTSSTATSKPNAAPRFAADEVLPSVLGLSLGLAGFLRLG